MFNTNAACTEECVDHLFSPSPSRMGTGKADPAWTAYFQLHI